MEFAEYESRWKGLHQSTHQERVEYNAIALAYEVGECLNFIKKKMRGDTEDYTRDILLELGDILYYLTGLTEALGSNLDEIAEANLEKLAIHRDSEGGW